MLRVPVVLQPIARRPATVSPTDERPASLANDTPLPMGWFIPGSRAADWLALLAQLPIPHQHLQLIVVPTSTKSQTPLGILATRSKDFTETMADNAERVETGFPRDASIHCHAYRCHFDALWLPEDAQLRPALTPQEFRAWANPNLIYLWHPTSGLIGAEPTERLSCADLLRAPTERFVSWDLATPGPELSSRLWSVRSTQPFTVAETLDQGKDGIGESSAEIHWQPEPDRPPSLLESVVRGANPVSGAVARAVLAFTQSVAGTADSRTWINDLEDWARSRLSGIQQRSFERRNRELIRLLDLLQNDPDQGLRYALPIDSQHSHRGRAAHSHELTKNEVSYDLEKIAGGQPVDAWDIPTPLREQLSARYRDLAEREVTLGRFKRAAYIYAHLLADFRAAARVLENGKLYREAAVLYRHKLGEHSAAIRCLEHGRFWSEAIELLESLQMDEKAGDLYIKLNQPEQAAVCYRRVVQRYLSSCDFISAAKVQEEKLSAPEEALESLQIGFQQTRPAECLSHIFRIHTLLGRHADTLEWIDRARQRTSEPEQLLPLANLLRSVADQYPDPGARQKAADTVIRIVSDALQSQHAAQQRIPISGILRTLADLAPADLLLERDCHRYTQTFYAERLRTPIRTEPSIGGQKSLVRLVASRQLSDHRDQWSRFVSDLNLQNLGDTRWLTALSVAHRPLVFGVCGDLLMAQYLNWKNDNVDVRCLRLPSPPEESPLIIKVASSQASIGLTQVGSSVFPLAKGAGPGGTDSQVPTVAWRFAPSDGDHILQVQHPVNVANDILGLEALSSDSWAQIRWQNQALLLETVATAGGLTSRILKHESEIESLELPIPMAYNGRSLFVAIGHQLLIIRDAHTRTLEFESTIRSITSSLSNTRPRIAIGFDSGLAYLANHFEVADATHLCLDVPNPILHFNRTGHLIVAANDFCQAFETRNDKIQRVGHWDTTTTRAILRTPQAEEFALLDDHGTLRQYSIRLD